jgi:hypothetical protein
MRSYRFPEKKAAIIPMLRRRLLALNIFAKRISEKGIAKRQRRIDGQYDFDFASDFYQGRKAVFNISINAVN